MTSIPPDPIGPGHLSVALQFEGAQLEQAVRLLQAVAERYGASRSAPLAAAPAGPTPAAAMPSMNAPGAAGPPAPEAKPLPRQPAPAAVLPSVPPAPPIPTPVPPAPPIPTPVPPPPQQAFPQPAHPPFAYPRPPPQTFPFPPSPFPPNPQSLPMHPQPGIPPPPFPHGSLPPQPGFVRPPMPPASMPMFPHPHPPVIPTAAPAMAPAPPPMHTPGPRPAAPPEPPAAALHQPPWEMVWTTDPLDHNQEPVHALAYCPTITGLPGGDGHAGWLISSSRHTLNLWEASPRGGTKSGEPCIMMMHSQLTDFLSTHLAVEESLSTMFAVSLDTKAASECVTVHSLSADTGILPYKYRIVPPMDGGTASANYVGVPAGKPAPKQRGLHRVASLHELGRHLRNHIVAAHGPRVLVYEVPPGGASAPAHATVGLKPKREWRALEGGPQAAVTALHANSLSGGLLFTGATDGSVSIWSLLDRPGAKVRDLKCDKHVSALQLISNTTLVTSSMDGKVLLWDMRKPSAPFRTVIPDGSPALQLEVAPNTQCMAVATAKGVYSVNLLDGGGTVMPISPTPFTRPPLALSWNWGTNEVYVGGHNGAITVYRQSV